MPRKRIYDEDLRLNVIINGKGLEKGNKKLIAELGKQERKMRELEMASANLAKQYKAVVKAQGKNSNAARDLSKQIQINNASIRAQQKVLKGLRNEIGLSGMTLQQLRNHLKALKVELNNNRGSAAFTKQLRREIRLTQMEMVKLETGAGKLAQGWERLASKANRFGTIMGYLMIGFYMIWRSVGKVTYRMKDLEDRIGGVRKLAKLTRDEVWELKVAFDQLDSRTATDKLLDMSKIAGRLGVEGQQNILKFVQAADMITIALKESLGDEVEEIMRKMGKLVNVFRLTDDMTLDTALLRIGSVLNELDKRSAASAESILEYTYRLSSYAEVVNLSAADVMGLAASLDALGVRSEMGATQILKLLRGMGKSDNAEQFARILGVTADEYERMLANDPNEMFLGLLEMLSANADNMIQMEKLMGDYGVDGQRLIQVLGPIINNLDIVRQQQQIANEEFEKGTSVLMEYEIMNQTFGAELDKTTKKLRSMADLLYKRLMGAVLKIYKSFVNFTIGIKELKIWLMNHAVLIKTIIFLYMALKAPALYRIMLLTAETIQLKLLILVEKLDVKWKQLSLLWTRKLTIEQGRLLVANKSLRLSFLLFHGQLKKAWALLKTMAVGSAALSTVFIALAATVGLLVGAFLIARKRMDKLTDAQKKMIEMSRDANKRYAEERSNLDLLYKAYENAEDKTKARADLIGILNDQYGDYLKYTIDEKSNLFDLAKAYDDVTTAMRRMFDLEELKTTRKDLVGSQTDIDRQIAEKQAELENLQKLRDAELARGGTGSTTSVIINKTKREIADLTKESKSYSDSIGEIDTDISKMEVSVAELSDKLEKVNKTNAEYDDALKMLQFEQKEREALLTERALNEKKTTDWLNEEKLKSDIVYYKARKELDETMGKEEDILDSRIAIANAYLQLRSDETKGDKEREKQFKEYSENIEETFGGLQSEQHERFANGEIEQEQYSRNIIRIEIAKLNRLRDLHIEYDESISDINKKIYESEKELASLTPENEAEYEKIKTAREEALRDKLLQLTQDYITEKEVRDNFNDLVLNAELAFLQNLWQARYDLGLSTIEIDQLIADKRKEIFDGQIADAEDFTKNIDQVLGRREKNYLSKVIYYNKEIAKTQNDVAIKSEDKAEKIALLKEKIADSNEAEALSWATSAASAVESAETIQEATAAVLNMIRQKIRAYLAEAVAGAIAKEIGSKGILGVITAGAAAAAVMVLFDSLIPKFGTDTKTGMVTGSTLSYKPKTSQAASGQYPVVGADDGRLYSATYGGPVKSGIYGSPTLLDMAGGRTLVGETRLPELVIDGSTFRKMRMNAPQLVNDIYSMAGRIQQNADGNYPAINQQMYQPGIDRETAIALTKAIEAFTQKKLTVYSELIKKDIDALNKIEQERGM